MKILLTAFEAFGGESINPTQEALKLLPDSIGGAEILRMTVPVTFSGAAEPVLAAIDCERPDAVLCLGQAGGRAGLTPERVAINIDDARIPDNAGAQPADEPIAAGAPAAYFATLPIKAMTEAIRAAGVPASVSDSAGTFVCNHLMYAVLRHIAEAGLPIRAGFMHVPFLPEQTAARPDTPSLPMDELVRGITSAVEAIAAAP